VVGHCRRLCDGSVVVTLQDVTSTRELEDQLAEAQKMESLGLLTGGLAHDFRNLLTVVQANAALLLEEADPGHPFRSQLEEMHRAAERGGELVAQLMAHARPGEREVQAVDLREVVRAIRPMVDRLVGDDVAVVVEEADEPLGVVAAPVRLEQVILNLVTNARDAMPRGGTLVLSTGSWDPPDRVRRERPGLPSGRLARLSVRDTGTGIPPATLARIFQPFFTTKSPSRGTGLGLPSVVRIVESGGGWVAAESEPGLGSTFHVNLPRAELCAPDAEPPSTGEAVHTGRASADASSDGGGPEGGDAEGEDAEGEPPTVLIVEDEPAIRSVLRQILERGGIRVLSAASGEEAVQLAVDFTGRVDALLTDLNLPGMDGTEIGRAVRELHPGVRVTIMSGYGPDAVEQELLEGLEADFLQKPFDPESLVGLVRSMSAGRGAAPAPPAGASTGVR
jgi:nitrogen-specific signal transduction histidine kinase/ActR/RegA family two-component response regulator